MKKKSTKKLFYIKAENNLKVKSAKYFKTMKTELNDITLIEIKKSTNVYQIMAVCL